MGLGALVSLILNQTTGKKFGRETSGRYVGLVSSGFLGGEGVTGVLIALFSMLR